MALFTAQQILEAAKMFRSVPIENRGLTSGLMKDLNVNQDFSDLSGNLNVTVILVNEKITRI